MTRFPAQILPLSHLFQTHDGEIKSQRNWLSIKSETWVHQDVCASQYSLMSNCHRVHRYRRIVQCHGGLGNLETQRCGLLDGQ